MLKETLTMLLIFLHQITAYAYDLFSTFFKFR
jgi:hypothetical protein